MRTNNRLRRIFIIIHITLLSKTILATDFILGLSNQNFTNRRILSSAMELIQPESNIGCTELCHRTSLCRSISFNEDAKQCALYDEDFLDTSDVKYVSENSWMYYYVLPFKENFIPAASCTQYPSSNERPCSLFCMKYVSGPFVIPIETAADECAKMNGALVRIDRALKQYCVEMLLATVADGVVYIQGKNDDGIWRFDDGTEMTYLNWNSAANQPAGLVGEDYVGVRRDKNYLWHDFFSGDLKSFVCDLY